MSTGQSDQNPAETPEGNKSGRLASARAALRDLPRGTVVWGGLALALVLAVSGYMIYSSVSDSRSSQRWGRLNAAGTLADLESVAADHPETLQADVADLKRARYLLTVEGLQRVATNDARQRALALKAVSDARTIFVKLTGRFEGSPAMLAEAYRGAAAAEEALIGVESQVTYTAAPKPGAKTEEKTVEIEPGDIKKAVEYYNGAKQAAGPETPVGEYAAAQIAYLNGQDIKYPQQAAALNNFLSGADFRLKGRGKEPGLPGLPGGPKGDPGPPKKAKDPAVPVAPELKLDLPDPEEEPKKDPPGKKKS